MNFVEDVISNIVEPTMSEKLVNYSSKMAK